MGCESTGTTAEHVEPGREWGDGEREQVGEAAVPESCFGPK
jgi:hypothetical protein